MRTRKSPVTWTGTERPMRYSAELLRDRLVCKPARQWARENLSDGDIITTALLTSVPNPEWIWWLGARVDDGRTLAWVAANLALGEAGNWSDKIALLAGTINGENCDSVRSAVAQEALSLPLLARPVVAAAREAIDAAATGETRRAANGAARAAGRSAVARLARERYAARLADDEKVYEGARVSAETGLWEKLRREAILFMEAGGYAAS